MEKENIPRRMRRFHRERQGKKEAEKEFALKRKQGMEAVPSEEAIEEELLEKKGGYSKKYAEGIAGSLVEEEREEAERRGRAEELALNEVRRFREQYNRLPMRTEYEQIIESIFSIMQAEDRKEREKIAAEKKEKREKEKLARREQRAARGKKQLEEVELPEEKPRPKIGIEDLEVKDILGKTGEKEELALPEGEEKEEFSLKELEEAPEETGKCKNCGRATEQQVYCSECGQAFCEKCAKSTRRVLDKLEMQCPNCGTKTKK